jgi:CRP/FNR family transcriptional regulator, transcriptional activator FtrB
MPLRPQDLTAVKQLPLLKAVSRRTVARLLAAARVHHFGAGSVLFREGEPSDYLYVALDGHVSLKADSGASSDYVIEFVPPGQPFILAAVLLEKPFLMSAQVVQPGRVLLLPAAEFRNCAATDLGLARELNRAASLHWRSLIGQIKSLKMQTGAQRLAAFLLSLSASQSGESVVELPCERRVLAAWLGMVPTSASRAFRELEKLGVEGRGHRLRIRAPARLAEFAGTIY